MTELYNIDIIIQNFAQSSFDDFQLSKEHMKEYMIELFQNWKYSENIRDKDIKKTIIAELTALESAIQQHHQSKEPIHLLESFDYKYGHWNVLYWIMCRWYKDAKSINDTPKWYRNIADILTAEKLPHDCIYIIKIILSTLNC